MHMKSHRRCELKSCPEGGEMCLFWGRGTRAPAVTYCVKIIITLTYPSSPPLLLSLSLSPLSFLLFHMLQTMFIVHCNSKIFKMKLCPSLHCNRGRPWHLSQITISFATGSNFKQELRHLIKLKMHVLSKDLNVINIVCCKKIK